MLKKPTAKDLVEGIQVVHTILKHLCEADALAAVILTDESYDKVRGFFRESARPYNPSGLLIDPEMDKGFIVDGLLILRGTKPE